MVLNLRVTLTEKSTEILLDQHRLTITITQSDLKQTPQPTQAIYLTTAKNQVDLITETAPTAKDLKKTLIVISSTDWQTEPTYLKRQLIQAAHQAGHLTELEEEKIPQNLAALTAQISQDVQLVLQRFGYSLGQDQKKKGGKPRHKWTKEIAAIPFYVDHSDSKATVFWQKRTEMLIKAGAKLKTEVPLNKDGSVGFSARFAQKLRSEHQAEFKDGYTTADIVLKSVNEVGLFLYFAGTNSWLQLKDENGKSINEWTVVS
ncbi:hypothetical protein LFYK43_11580 [Ligilactobacillus salitolerans]|uniref:Uncharacterized protein n=1 Tax=Ligilactobacillus salitolerans TaxID=1808352 RepID=A0A401IT55_9LACO|nr:hypothetical protein [Ligilactobacillus salitolerans]GBG94699.1 hypothetical protein LFYK43_11580 [Ligilactobacillus salitolerans]